MKLPIKAAKDVAKAYGLCQVIIIARTGLANGKTIDHVVTYGESLGDCRLAAEAGNNLKRFMGWDESKCHSWPRRIGGKG